MLLSWVTFKFYVSFPSSSKDVPGPLNSINQASLCILHMPFVSDIEGGPISFLTFCLQSRHQAGGIPRLPDAITIDTVTALLR